MRHEQHSEGTLVSDHEEAPVEGLELFLNGSVEEEVCVQVDELLSVVISDGCRGTAWFQVLCDG